MAHGSTTSFYAVVREQGERWNPSLPMRQQEQWEAHAAFMDALADEGFVILGGPLSGGEHHKALLIIAADSVQAVEDRLAADPWTTLRILRTAVIESWEILLGHL
jgi:uncharacterized protein